MITVSAMKIKPKPCKHCGSENHLSWKCFQNPNREAQTKKKLGNGKIAYKWYATRAKWFKQFPDDIDFQCYICGHYLPREQTTLDHIESRTRHPELRFELSNLAPCCYSCNQAKGSLSLSQYNEKL